MTIKSVARPSVQSIKTSSTQATKAAAPLKELQHLAAAALKAKKADQMPDIQKVIELARNVVSNPKSSRGDVSQALLALAKTDAKLGSFAGWGPTGIEPSIEKGAEAIVGKLSKWSDLDGLALAEDKTFAYLAKSGGKLSNEGLLAIAKAYQPAYEAMAGQ